MPESRTHTLLPTAYKKMKQILTNPYSFSSLTAPNRLVAQAMEINCGAGDGKVTPTIIERYRRLAEGLWGMVFTEAISVTEKHLARKNGLVLTEGSIDGFARLVDSFKKANGRSLFLFQLTHSGRMTGSFSRRVRGYDDDEHDIPVLSEMELDEAVGQSIAAARLAKRVGADGVDIKACHGYLGGELLRPRNRRADRYGTTVENRVRYIADVVREIKRSCPDFLVGSRVSLFEGIRGGCGAIGPDEVIEDLSDMLEALSILVGAGADFINVSAGIPAITPRLTRPDAACTFSMYHHFRYAKAVKDRFKGTAVIGSAYSVGGKLGDLWAEENIGKGYTDFAGFGRQNLADPLMPKKLFEETGNIDYCVLCGGCSLLLKKQDVVRCVVYDRDHDG